MKGLDYMALFLLDLFLRREKGYSGIPLFGMFVLIQLPYRFEKEVKNCNLSLIITSCLFICEMLDVII